MYVWQITFYYSRRGPELIDIAGRIPTDTKHEARIYPLPHTYVVKDLVPDLTQFYKQYKSIKPYLRRETKSEDVCPLPSSLSLLHSTH